MNPSSRPVRSDAPVRTASRYWFGVARWTLVILLVFELVIRVFVMRLPPHVYKPEWGFVPAPYTTSLQGREGYGVLHYLEDGEIRTPYSDGVSVVVLGDSTVQGAQVDDSENFVSLAEGILRSQGIKADLHNLGAGDRTVADHVFIAPAVNAKYAPKIVVVQVSMASFFYAYNKDNENHFELEQDGALKLIHINPDERSLRYKNLIYSSGLLSFLDFRLQVARQESNVLKAREMKMDQADNAGFQDANPEAISQNATTDEQAFNTRILPMARLLKNAYPNSQVVFLVVPYTPDISYGAEHEVSWVSGNDALLVLGLSHEADMHVVYVNNEFRNVYRKFHALPRGSFNSEFNFGHLNEYGHQAVALVLSDALETLLK